MVCVVVFVMCINGIDIFVSILFVNLCIVFVVRIRILVFVFCSFRVFLFRICFVVV